VKRNDLLLTALSALLLALSRLPLHLGWLVFFAWLPLLRVFERGQASSRDLLRMGFIMSVVYCGIVFYWLFYVHPGALPGVMLVYIFAYYLVFYGINRIFLTLPRWRCGFSEHPHHLRVHPEFRRNPLSLVQSGLFPGGIWRSDPGS